MKESESTVVAIEKAVEGIYISSPKRHERFYIEDGSVILLVSLNLHCKREFYKLRDA